MSKEELKPSAQTKIYVAQSKETNLMANRLHLDFSINGTQDRKDFVDEYV